MRPPQKFLVWNPDHSLPKIPHKTFEAAEKEARRLAQQHPGQQFLVMAPASVVQVQDPVQVTRFDWHEVNDPFAF